VVHAESGAGAPLDHRTVLGRGALFCVLAVTSGWAGIILGGIGMATGTFLAVDKWVHRRQSRESSLAHEIKIVKAQVEAITLRVETGSGVWNKAVELGHTVQALQTMVGEVKVILDQASRRDERDSERITTIKEQLARIEEHLRSTDKDVTAVTNSVNALREWMISSERRHAD